MSSVIYIERIGWYLKIKYDKGFRKRNDKGSWVKESGIRK